MFAAVAASQAAQIDGEVKPLVSPVSLSISGSQPVASYTVTLKNTGSSNTINNGRLVAVTSVVSGVSGAKAVFKSVSGGGATCSTSLQGTRVDCSVGSLTVNQPKVFTLTFFSPSSGTQIDLVWDAVFDSGSPPGGSNGDNGTTSILLAAIDAASVTSAVPPNETVSVFTGNLALPSGSDPFTVAVTVPPVSAPTTASVLETEVSGNKNCKSLRNFVKCYRSTITIPEVALASSGSYLTFDLRVDKSNIRKGARIDKVLIQYDDNNSPPILVPTVQFCSKDGSGNPLPNSDGIPCIAKADDYTLTSSPAGWFGFQYRIISLKNGSFNLF